MALSERWHVGPLLGRGGMARVVSVTHRSTGVLAALKVSEVDDPDLRARARDEVLRLAAVDDAHVVEIWDVDLLDGPMAQALDVAPGATAFVMPRLQGVWAAPKTWPELSSLLMEVLQGLAAVHGAGLLHLDLKPSNVLRTSATLAQGHAVLADLGVSLARGAAWNAAQVLPVGTVGFMAPELFTQVPAQWGPAADLYSVGCLAWFWATGCLVVEAKTGLAASAARAAGVSAFAPVVAVPPGFERWVRALLALDPRQRPVAVAPVLSHLRTLSLHAPVGEAAAVDTAVVGPTVASTQVASVAAPIWRGRAETGSGLPPAPWPEEWPTASARHRRAGLRTSALLTLLPMRTVGRKDAKAALWHALTRAHQAEAPLWVALSGPEGVGRAHLLRHAIHTLRQHTDAEVVVGTVADLRQTVREGASRLVVWCVADAVAQRDDLAALAERPLARVCVLVRCRAVDALPEGARARVVEVPLTPLNLTAVRRALADWVGLSPRVVAELVLWCGHDLALAVRALHRLQADGALRLGPKGVHAPLPAISDAVRRASPAHDAKTWRQAWAAVPAAARPAVAGWIAWGDTVPTVAWEAAYGPSAEAAKVWAVAEHALPGWPWVVCSEAGDTWMWRSTPTRAGLRAAAGARVGEAHRHLAQAVPWDERSQWRGALHRWEGGEVLEGVADYLRTVSGHISHGGMAWAGRRLAKVREALQAHHVTPEDPQRGALWAGLWVAEAELYSSHGSREACWQACERAVQLQGGGRDGGRYAAKALGRMAFLADVQLWPNRFPASLAQALEDAARRGDFPQATATTRLGWVALRRGDAAGSVALFERARADAEPGSVHDLFARGGIAAARVAGHDPHSVAVVQAVLPEMVRRVASAEADILACLVDAHRVAGDLDAAATIAQRMLAAAAGGESRIDPGMRMRWALVCLARGEAVEAVQELRSTMASLTDEGPGWRGTLGAHLAYAVLQRDGAATDEVRSEWAEAAAHLAVAGCRDLDVDRAVSALQAAGCGQSMS